jgi:hypoxanthine-guanine phosphoribosyltransferase
MTSERVVTLFSAEAIEQRIDELAAAIAATVPGTSPWSAS